MWEIPIFAQEKKDGLAQLVRSNASLAYCSPARPIARSDRQEVIQSIFEKTTAAANKGQMDLFYLDTILVTAGTMNLNDDIFLREPTWAARHTPEDKPFNYGHDQLDIIGHITSNAAVNEEYEAIAEDSAVDELPDKFHILTSAVIYKAWADKKQSERIEKIIAEIGEDKWFVSMECLFRGFDYGFYNAKGECKVVARNEDSAFLTKYLRAYNGSGKYKGDKIGRVISNLVFSGKGLVEKPANPESIIFNNTASFKSTFANLGYINSCELDNSNIQEEIEDMADTDKTIAELERKLEAALSETKRVTEKLEAANVQSAKASEDKISSLTVAVEDEKKKTKDAEDKKAKAEVELAEAKKQLETVTAAKEDLEKKFDKSKKSEKVSKAGLSEEDASAFLTDWADASEEVFDKALALAVKSATAGTGSLEKPAGVKKVAEIKFGDDSGAQRVNSGGNGASTSDNLGTASERVLEGAEGTNEGTGAAAANVTKTETNRESLGAFLEASLKNHKSRKR